MLYKHRLNPPTDLIESASFLVTVAFMRERPAIAFVARSVAQHLEREKLARILALQVPIELPAVGIITMRAACAHPQRRN